METLSKTPLIRKETIMTIVALVVYFITFHFLNGWESRREEIYLISTFAAAAAFISTTIILFIFLLISRVRETNISKKFILLLFLVEGGVIILGIIFTGWSSV